MLFGSYIFLFWFLTLTIGVHYLLPTRVRTAWLALTSFVFYGWWKPEYCALLFIVILINYLGGKFMVRTENPKAKTFWLVLSVAGSLAILGFFKYAGMFSDWAEAMTRLFTGGASADRVIPHIGVLLPIGISFFTFQAISYTVDLYRGHAKEANSLVHFAAYIAMFPQLIAGPIVRYSWIEQELRTRTYSFAKFMLGLHFFAIGLAKKAIVADTFALAVPMAFHDGSISVTAAWLGSLAYHLQIYFDFSAYSDMAVGLGLMIGFTFPMNFNSPYKSASITEFWRRWHISLSTWLRDYLYIPLGGNKLGSYRTYVNLMMVMLLGGLWHGASILFVIWGLWHGVLLALERALGDKHPLKRMPKPLAVLITNFLVLLSWVAFRAENWEMAVQVYAGLFGWGVPFMEAGLQALVHPAVIISVPIGLLVCWFLPNSWEFNVHQRSVVVLRTAVLLIVSVIVVLSNQGSPFLYFQF